MKRKDNSGLVKYRTKIANVLRFCGLNPQRLGVRAWQFAIVAIRLGFRNRQSTLACAKKIYERKDDVPFVLYENEAPYMSF